MTTPAHRPLAVLLGTLGLGLVLVLALAGCRGLLDALPSPEPAPRPGPAPAPDRAPSGDGRRVEGGPAVAATLPDRWVIWTFQSPMGRARDFERLIEMVRIGVSQRSGADAARLAVRRIQRRGLGPGEVAICLQDWGVPGAKLPPWRHPADELVVDGERVDCLWSAKGVAAARRWTDEFVATYRALQAEDPSIPDPFRFHFDVEEMIYANRGDGPARFDAMRRDRRWDREPIPGHGGRTLAELTAQYLAAGGTLPNPDRRWTAAENLPWMRWYQGVVVTACDGIMAEAAYERIHDAFPGCGTSNWWTSTGFDGEDGRLMTWRTRDGIGYASRPSGSIQAPVLYWVRDDALGPLESLEDAAIRVAREKLEASRRSFTSPSRPHRNFAPWIELVGNSRDGRVVTSRMNREMLLAMDAMGIREAILWSDATPNDGFKWERFADVLDEIGLLGPRRAASAAGLRSAP